MVIVDVSASMQTDDGQNGTRLAEAQTALRQWLLAAPADEDMLLLAASGHAEVLAGWGSDRATLDEEDVGPPLFDEGFDDVEQGDEDAGA